MEHHNPLTVNPKSSHKFITIGEIMLRLTPPNYQNIRMANEFEATYGGSEANIALSLANLGIDSTFFSVVPNNSIGKSAIRMLRSNDVHCTPVILSTPEETPTHRLGTYYLETGYGIRASKVTYDRKHSAITEYDLSKVDIKALLEGFTWLHVSGITPALNKTCADFILNCLKVAKDLGLTTSFDGNFRSKLFTFNILDRVGGGDAFASGLIYAMMRNYKPMDMVNFAVASSVIKHTIHGDANITDDARAIKEIMNMNFDIKR